MKKGWIKYSYLFTILFFILGYFNIVFAWIGFFCLALRKQNTMVNSKEALQEICPVIGLQARKN